MKEGAYWLVYVLNIDGQPLMPTNRHGKVKHLLKTGKAKVIKRCPFTIKLLYETNNYTQDLILGVDTGSGTFATAVSRNNGDIVYLSEVILRNDITIKMSRRAMYRTMRRYYKTRYRKARWLNRKNSMRSDRFSPTMVSKHHSHEKEIEYIKSILPISKIIIEAGQFDTHLMKNPSLANPKIRPWGYQKGPNYGFENTKAMILNRDDYICQYCKGKHKDNKLEVHHIIYKSNGGSNEENNLITLCHTCHQNVHKGIIDLKSKGKIKGTLKYATQMNSIRIQLFRKYPEAIETFGYITKANRLALGVDKKHYYDACVIATGGKPFNIKCNLIKKRCVADGDFRQTRGKRSEQKLPTGKILGFRRFDKVKYLGKEYFIKGRYSIGGYADLMDIENNTIDFSFMPRGWRIPKVKNMIRLGARKSWIIITNII